MKIKELISQPYPFLDGERSVAERIGRSFLTGLFIAAFLMIFQPFGASQWHSVEKYWVLAGFGLVTFLCLIFVRLVVINIFPGFFNESDWTVGREICVNIGFLFFIASGNFVYEALLYNPQWSLKHYMWSFLTVVAIGIFPIVFDVLAKYRRAVRKYGKEEEMILSEPAEEKIKVTAENGLDFLEFKTGDLLYIESADNYAKFVLAQKEPQLLRSSLSRLENQMVSSRIVRCHRSYMANLSKVQRVTGNAQGYKLHLDGLDKPVPVARKYSDIISDLRPAN